MADEPAALERVIEIVTVEILQISSIDLVAENFHGQLFVEFRFPGGASDAALSSKSPDFPIGPDGKPTFRPSAIWYVNQVDFNNAVKYTILNKDVFEMGEDIHAKLRFEGTFTTNLELEQFPFDTQLITFSLAVNVRTTGMTPVVLRNADDLQCHNIRNDEFHLQEIYHVQESLHVKTGTCGHAPRIFPCVNVSILLERKPGFFVINVMVPVFLFVPLSAMQQSIPVTDLGSRMEFGLAMLFTNVTFKFSIASTLPHISYLTLLDKYLLVAGLINLLICFESAAIWRVLSRYSVFHVIEADDITETLGGAFYGSLVYDQTPRPVTSAVVQPGNGYFLKEGLESAMLTDEVCFIVNLSLWAMVNLFLILRLRSLQILSGFEPPPPTAGGTPLYRKKSSEIRRTSRASMESQRRRVTNWFGWRTTAQKLQYPSAPTRPRNGSQMSLPNDATGTAPSLVHLSSR